VRRKRVFASITLALTARLLLAQSLATKEGSAAAPVPRSLPTPLCSAEAAKSAGAVNIEQASAAKAMAMNCAACHLADREKTDAGFRIK
jgi:hypothetical protein